MGSLYYMCETNVTKFSCQSNITDCTKYKFPVKYNMFDKCISNNTAASLGTTVLATDPQCQYQYLITEDYFGVQNARTISV